MQRHTFIGGLIAGLAALCGVKAAEPVFIPPEFDFAAQAKMWKEVVVDIDDHPPHEHKLFQMVEGPDGMIHMWDVRMEIPDGWRVVVSKDTGLVHRLAYQPIAS